MQISGLRELQALDLSGHTQVSDLSALCQGTREFLPVEKGAVRLAAGDETTDLARGDSAHYPADVAHRIENIGQGEAIAFLVDICDRRPAAR